MLRFNAGHVGDKYERLAAAMGLAPRADLAAFVEDLNSRIGMPKSLREMGVPVSVIAEMAEKAEKDHSTPTNPRPCTAQDYAALVKLDLLDGETVAENPTSKLDVVDIASADPGSVERKSLDSAWLGDAKLNIVDLDQRH